MAKERKQPKTWHGKVWHFLWYDDSMLSWVVSLFVAFIFIKFILYPGLGFVLGTNYPIVAVVSGSMEHSLRESNVCVAMNNESCIDTARAYTICQQSFATKQRLTFDGWWDICGNWYENNSFNTISKDEFREFSFKNGFDTATIIVVRGKDIEDIAIGDILVYQTTQPYPIIHRVINKYEENGVTYFTTKGDHNGDVIRRSDYEVRISEDQVLGVAWFGIPYLGYVKIWATEFVFRPIVSLFR